jgi:hypothetical protein
VLCVVEESNLKRCWDDDYKEDIVASLTALDLIFQHSRKSKYVALDFSSQVVSLVARVA